MSGSTYTSRWTIPVLILTCMLLASPANAVAFSPRSNVNPMEVASALGVSSAQAAKDLSMQRAAFSAIQEFINSGDTVWFDDHTAQLHVYTPAPGNQPSVSLPAAVAARIVYDPTKPTFHTPSELRSQATGCTQQFHGCTPVQDGVEMYRYYPIGVNCTAGWVLQGYSGGTYMLTAGHCATWGTTWFSNPFSVHTASGAECTPGTTITGNAPWSGHDWAIESLNGACGGVWGAIHDFQKNEDFLQQGAVHAFVGETVCHYGITTPEACGQVVGVNVSKVIEYESGNWTVQHLDVICGLAQHGDSGGPASDYTYRGAATGIVISGGTGNSECTKKTGNSHSFSEEEIFPILEETGTYVY